MTERERLIDLINAGKYIYPTRPVFNGMRQDLAVFLADHLLRSGVIVPPVKIGQTVYDAGEFFLEGCSCPEIYSLNDNEITVYKIGRGDNRFTYDGMDIGHEDIGKTVFLSREEAEKALKERSEGK